MEKKSCTFCKIVNGSLPAAVVYENDNIICFLPDDNLDTWPKLPKIDVDREELLSKLETE